MNKVLYVFLFSIISLNTVAGAEVKSLLGKVQQQQDFIQKIDKASELFLGKPYVLGPLGEGSSGKFDQRPLYTFEGFDCVTYVNTALALAYAKNDRDFVSYLKALGYHDAKVGYLSRNHFTSLDWNLNNQSFLKDITKTIVNRQGKQLAVQSTAIIDKKSWFQHKQIKDLALPGLAEAEKQKRLQQLHRKAEHLKPQSVTIDYLPLKAIFNDKGEADPFVFEQIPNGAIVEIVRPNWNVKDKIGTNMHISHLGFAIRKSGKPLQFRQASSLHKQVMDSRLDEYLKAYLNSSSVKGIKVLLPKG